MRVLVVGLGSIGKRHIEVIKTLYPNFIVSVLRHKKCCDEDVAKLRLEKCFTQIKEAIKFQPHFAVIANPATFHIEVAMELAQAGIHLLIEKPLSHVVNGIDALISLCQERNIKLMTAYNLRFLPSLTAFREYLESQAAGKIISVRAEVGQHLSGWRPTVDYRNTVTAQKRLGGGVLLELTHDIDYLLWLFGPAAWVKANTSQQGQFEIDVEDTSHLIIGFKKNQLVATLNLDFIRHDTCRYCIAIGDKGSLRWDAVAGTIESFAEGATEWQPLFEHKVERNYTYEKEIKHFVECVSHGLSPVITGKDGRDSVEIVEAAKKSSELGKTIYLTGE